MWPPVYTARFIAPFVYCRVARDIDDDAVTASFRATVTLFFLVRKCRRRPPLNSFVETIHILMVLSPNSPRFIYIAYTRYTRVLAKESENAGLLISNIFVRCKKTRFVPNSTSRRDFVRLLLKSFALPWAAHPLAISICVAARLRARHACTRASSSAVARSLVRSFVARNVRVGRERILRFQLTMVIRLFVVLLLSSTAKRMDLVLESVIFLEKIIGN